mmetsp:Transcript_18525/g.33128  ORF Transcript_18525/g.33128 Transcript_18525/m.33128 type:complete len:165 (-) Transcript_18525:25-519(-)
MGTDGGDCGDGRGRCGTRRDHLVGRNQWRSVLAASREQILMACLFQTFMRKAGKDLKAMEDAYARKLLGLLDRPGRWASGEDVAEAGRYYLQVCRARMRWGGSMAKMDVARFMIDEAVRTHFASGAPRRWVRNTAHAHVKSIGASGTFVQFRILALAGAAIRFV